MNINYQIEKRKAISKSFESKIVVAEQLSGEGVLDCLKCGVVGSLQ